MVLLDSLTTILPENESLQYIVLLLVFPAFIYAAGSAFVAATSYRLNVPIVGVDTTKWFSILRARLRYVGHGNHMILEGFREYSDEMYQVPTLNETLLLLPPRYVEELKSLPEDIMSSSHAVADYMMGEYTTLDVECFGPAMWNVARTLLQRRLGLLAEPSYRVCSKVFAEQFTSYPDWTPVVIHPKVLQMISRMTSRTLVGTKLSEDPVWHEALVGYASSIFPASVKLKVVPVPLRQIYALFLPILYKIRYHRRTAQKILYAEIKRRREERKTSTAEPKERRLDTLDWLDDVSQGVELRPRNMVKRELLLGFGAIHTTTNHTTNVIHDLATRWHEYAPELRTEIEEAIKEDGGRLRKSTFTKLSKLDSFMKESQRMNPLTILAFNRAVLKSHTLSDGYVLPRGIHIAVPSGAMGLSSQWHKDPETFDGFRFHRIRQDPALESPNAYLFSTTSIDTMTFGHGRYACPGRFFAGLQSKIILVHILLHYDLKVPGDGKRPRNLHVADANFPDPSQIILFKDRSPSSSTKTMDRSAE